MASKVGIFFGGSSEKRMASAREALQVFRVLDRALFEPVLVWLDPDGALRRLDPAFFAFAESAGDGGLPEEAALAGRLEQFGTPLEPGSLPHQLDFVVSTIADPTLLPLRGEGRLPFVGGEQATPEADQWLAAAGQAGDAVPDERPFFCLVVRRDDQVPVALPPTWADGSLLQGDAMLLARRRCERLFDRAGGPTLGVVRGALRAEEDLALRALELNPSFAPNGPVFSSLAHIGLHPAQALTFLLSSSLQGAIARDPEAAVLRDRLQRFSADLRDRQTRSAQRVGVLMGGAEPLSRLSLRAGRHVFDLLSALPGITPVPLLLASSAQGRIQLLQLPLTDLFGEDLPTFSGRKPDAPRETHLEIVRDACKPISQTYGSRGQVNVRKGLNEAALARTVDGVFLQTADPSADDGRLQDWLEDAGIPFTGPDTASVRINGDMTLVNKMLQRQGIPAPAFEVVRKGAFARDAEGTLEELETSLRYPLLALPAMGRHGGLARRLRDREALRAYLLLAFGLDPDREGPHREALHLDPEAAFPRQKRILITDVPEDGNPAFHTVLVGLKSQWTPEQKLAHQPFSPWVVERKPGDLEDAATSLSARVSAKHVPQVLDLARRAASAMNLQGLAEVEMFLLDDGQSAPMLEVASVRVLPLLHPGHPLLTIARADGTSGHDLVRAEWSFARGRSAGKTAVKPTPPEKKPAPTRPAAKAPTKPIPDPPGKPAPIPPRKPAPEPAATADPRSTPPPPGPGKPVGRLRRWGGNVLRFLTSGFFLRNLALMALFLLAVVFIIQFALGLYTRHGESVEVGEYVGKKLDDVERLAAARDFRIVVVDSVFMVEREPNVVLEQNPEPNALVKKNRRIYLTITSGTAPMVQLPPLQGAYNYDQYKRKALRLGLKPRVLDRRFDNRLEKNTILYLVYEGEEIREEDLSASGGVKVPKGSEIGFVITERITEEVAVPDLVCKGYQEAAFILNASELVIGKIEGNVPDRTTAYVYQQEPEAGTMIEKGNRVDLFLSLSPPPECPEE